MNNKVSVIIPTYGRSKLLSKAISSIIDQSYAEKEVIIVDDNIDEKIASETKNIALSYKNLIDINYIKNSSNLGGALSRNVGVEAATGNYIAFLDDDDFFAKDKLQTQISFMEQNELDVSLCDMFVVNENEIITSKRHYASCASPADFLIRGVAMTPMIIVKKDCAVNAGLFDNTARFQDHIFMLKLLKVGCSVGVLRKPLVYYYEHSEPRISNSNKSSLGYEARFVKERELFPLLTDNEIKRVELRQDIIKSKIISIEGGSLKASLFLLPKILSTRKTEDFILLTKTLVRNVTHKSKRF